TERQAVDGSGLESQEHRCKEYARQKGYEVVDVFKDSFTGGGDFMKRPAMSQLIKYLDEHRYEKFAIIFDDLKRFARDTEFHLRLRATLKGRGAVPECLNFNFDESPTGKFSEIVMAA